VYLGTLAFKIPGDVPDLYSFIRGFTNHAIGALTSCDVAAISRHDLEQITRTFCPGSVAGALDRCGDCARMADRFRTPQCLCAHRSFDV
jgi:hypothetical protein